MNLRRLSLFAVGALALAAALAWPAAAWAAGPGSEGGAGGGGLFGAIPFIVFIPLVGVVINLFAGRWLGERWAGTIASTAAGSAFLIAVLQAVGLSQNHFEAVVVPLADWIHIGELSIPWAFQVDTLSVTMMLVVTGVGTLIHIYAIGYMHADVRHNGDPDRFPRFFVYLNLFLAAMLILVTGNNYLMMFVGWEGVGLCSYLLIGFWFEKGEKNVGNARAGRKAFVANRVGDWAMLMAMFLIFWNFGSLTYNEVFAKVAEAHIAEGTMIAITLLLLVGATGKSAQIPLYVWLPDAMAGPTPVSALIHAATMVTAGVYMMTRSYALFALAPVSMQVVAWVGAATALFAGTIAVGQFDIKKVLAYSTISQLGFMVAAVGLGAYVAAIFHLATHAFFKALLFLSSGSVIQAMERGHEHAEQAAHARGGGGHGGHDAHGAHDKHDAHGAHGGGHHGPDPQDMRNMGGLWNRLPVTKWVYLIGSLALAGIVPFAGFWSKDEILHAQKNNFGVYLVLAIAAAFTAFYMTRQVWMVFFGKARTAAAKHAQESPRVMTYPLIVLALLSVLGGGLNLPSIAGWTPPGAHLMTEWLGHTVAATHEGAAAPTEGETTAHEGEAASAEGEAEGALDFGVAGISTLVALASIGLGYGLYRNRPATTAEADPLTQYLGPLFGVLNGKWYVDELYGVLILKPYDALSRFIADVVDWNFWHDWFHDKVVGGLFNLMARGLADGVDLGFIDAIANALGAAARGVATRVSRLQTGLVRSYALAVFLGVVAVMGYFLLVK